MSVIEATFAPGIVELEIDAIHPSALNVRTHVKDTDVAGLAESIAAQGLLHPIVVRPHPQLAGQYEIVCGERRWRALRLLARRDSQRYGYVTARVMRGSDAAALSVMHQENAERDDWSSYEKALFYKRAWDSGAFESLRVTARQLGIGLTTLHRYLKIFELPAWILKRFESGQLTMMHVELLVEADATHHRALVDGLTKRRWSKDQARAFLAGEPVQAPGPDAGLSPDRLVQKLERAGYTLTRRGRSYVLAIPATSKSDAARQLLSQLA